MAKSWIVGGRNTGEAYLQNATSYFLIGGSVEGDDISVVRNRFPQAATIRNWAVRVGANTLTGDCVVTVRVNDTTDTALSLTFSSTDADTEKIDTDSVSLSANDDIAGKVVCAAGGTSILLLSHGIEVEPTDAGDTLSHFCITTASSLSLGTAGTTYLPAFGVRINTADETAVDGGATWTSIGSFDTAYFGATSGTVTWDQDVTLRTRKNSANGGSSLVFTAADDGVTKYDTTGTDALADGDTFNYSIELGAGGTGTFNLENVHVWLVNTAGKFLLAAGKRVAAERINGSTTTYIILGGEMDEQPSASEAAAQLTAPFDMTVTAMQAMSDREVMSGNTVITLRKGGVATELAVTFTGGAPDNLGILEDTGAVSVTGGSDALATELALGAGTNRDFCYVVYLAEAVADVVQESTTPVLSLQAVNRAANY